MSDRNPPFTYRPPQFKMPSRKTLTTIILGVLIVGMLATGIYQVDQREEAVILLLGKFNRITGPGLHMKLPFGIERNYNGLTMGFWDWARGQKLLKAVLCGHTHVEERDRFSDTADMYVAGGNYEGFASEITFT